MTSGIRSGTKPGLFACVLLFGCQGQASSLRADGGANGGMDSAANNGVELDATMPTDAGDKDASGLDSSVKPDADTGACKPFVAPADCVIPANGSLPSELRCTGLYGDPEARSIACGVVAYAPAHALWSDDSVKNRYVSLPAGGKIDVSDPQSFVYPVGTQFWKEFNLKVPGGGTRLGETRILRKVTDQDWVYSTYVWNEEGTNATKQDDGVVNLFGLGHDVPTRDQCLQCHEGRQNIDSVPERLDLVLGWDPILLGPGATGITFASLLAEDLLTTSNVASPAALVTQIPGTPVEQAALGYLHANCGISCHNAGIQSKANITGFHMRLEQGKLASVHDTDTVVTGIHRSPSNNIPTIIEEPASGEFFDIRPLDLERSLLLNRMQRRDAGEMPNLGTNVVDPTGVAAVSAWIEAMTEANGYPAPAP